MPERVHPLAQSPLAGYLGGVTLGVLGSGASGEDVWVRGIPGADLRFRVRTCGPVWTVDLGVGLTADPRSPVVLRSSYIVECE